MLPTDDLSGEPGLDLELLSDEITDPLLVIGENNC